MSDPFWNEGVTDMDNASAVASGETARSRPVVITVICVLMFIGALITVPALLTDVPGRVGSWYPPFLALSAVVGLVCAVGLWRMRRWAVFTYTAFVALNQIVMLAMGVWSVLALLLPGVVVAAAFANLSKMK